MRQLQLHNNNYMSKTYLRDKRTDGSDSSSSSDSSDDDGDVEEIDDY